MRITNLEYTPIDVVAEIAVGVGVSATDTKNFFVGRTHPELVAILQEKLDMVLASFRRYGSQVCETQYIRDYGVDVRLVFQLRDSEERRIGFQIKADSEARLDQDRRRAKKAGHETLVGTLKRQAFEAENRLNVHEWWVFCCFDLTQHRDLVSAINSEVGSGLGKPKIRIVPPREAFGLLSKEDMEIDTLCTLLLCEDDEILRRARDECRRLTKLAKKLVLTTIGPALEGKDTLTLDEVRYMLHVDDIEKAGNAADLLERTGYLDQQSGGQLFDVLPASFPGLCALYFEARVRHELDPEEAASFVHRMMSAA